MENKKIPYLLILPQLVISTIFVAGLLNGLLQSFGVIPSLGLVSPTLQYYKDLLARGDFISSLFFSMKISLISSLLSVAFGVFICALLVRLRKTRGLSLRIVQLPIIVPHIVVAFFVLHFFSQNGLLARIFFHIGLISAQEQFPLLVFDRNGIGVILGYVWKELPFIVYFVMSLMENLDESLGEAALNLGASPRQAFFRIILPMCMPTVLGGFLIIFTYSFGAYELPFILGATEPKALPILSYIYYTHPDLLNRPYAMAVNGIITMISLASVAVYYWMYKRRKYEEI